MAPKAGTATLAFALTVACTQTDGAPDADVGSTSTEPSTSTGDAASTTPSAFTESGDATSAGQTETSSPGSSSGGADDSTGGGPPVACVVAQIDGTCTDIATCPEGATAFGGICEDIPSVQCCVDAEPPCSVDGAPGLCIDAAACAAPAVATAGQCPGAAHVQCCADPAMACDPEVMPLVNAGLVEEDWADNCPPGMVASEGLCVDRYEASLVELDGAGREVASWSPYFNPGATRVRAVSLRGAVPQGYITQVQATAACVEAGKRLCSDTEWLRACQGSQGSTYPYGAVLEPGRCNDARAMHPAIELFGTADAWIWSELGNPCISQIPASLDLTGQNAECLTEDGALDMMGNLHEWTADPAGTFRGGFYVDTAINGPGCLYATTAHDVSHWDYSTGFRCCADEVAP
jgi:hypothetical protein